MYSNHKAAVKMLNPGGDRNKSAMGRWMVELLQLRNSKNMYNFNGLDKLPFTGTNFIQK